MVDYHRISTKDQSRLHQFGAKVLPAIFLSYVYTRVESGKNALWSRTLKNWRRWTLLNSTPRRLNAKEVSTPQRSGNFIFPVADGTVKIFGREQRLRTSTLDLGPSGTRRRTRNSSRKVKWITFSTLHLKTTRRGMMRKLKSDFWVFYRRIHLSSSRWTQSQTAHAERKKHFLFRWSTSTLPEQHFHYWTYCWKNTLKITGTGMENRNCQMHGQDSQDLFYWREGHRKDTHGPERDSQGNKQPFVLMVYGQICGNLCPMQRKRKQNKDVLSRNQSSKTPDNWEEYSLMNQTMQKSSSQWKPLGQS